MMALCQGQCTSDLYTSYIPVHIINGRGFLLFVSCLTLFSWQRGHAWGPSSTRTCKGVVCTQMRNNWLNSCTLSSMEHLLDSFMPFLTESSMIPCLSCLKVCDYSSSQAMWLFHVFVRPARSILAFFQGHTHRICSHTSCG